MDRSLANDLPLIHRTSFVPGNFIIQQTISAIYLWSIMGNSTSQYLGGFATLTGIYINKQFVTGIMIYDTCLEQDRSLLKSGSVNQCFSTFTNTSMCAAFKYTSHKFLATPNQAR